MNSIDSLSPDIVRMLENMAGDKGIGMPGIRKTGRPELAGAGPKVSISLDDKEFGKY